MGQLAEPNVRAWMSVRGRETSISDEISILEAYNRVEGCENASQIQNIISRPHVHIPCSFLGPHGTFGFTPQGLIIVSRLYGFTFCTIHFPHYTTSMDSKKQLGNLLQAFLDPPVLQTKNFVCSGQDISCVPIKTSRAFQSLKI